MGSLVTDEELADLEKVAMRMRALRVRKFRVGEFECEFEPPIYFDSPISPPEPVSPEVAEQKAKEEYDRDLFYSVS